jgi:hypothetical protein
MRIPRKRSIAMLGLAVLLAGAGARDAARADPAPECRLDERFAPRQSVIVPAVVLGMAPWTEVTRQTIIATERSRAPESPAYVSLPRIMAAFFDKSGRHETIAAVLEGKIPGVGDRIRLESRHRDPTRPCSFVPWTVVPAEQSAMEESARARVPL